MGGKAGGVPRSWSAARADEAVGPTQGLERDEALLLGAVGLLEGRFAEALLELTRLRATMEAAKLLDILNNYTASADG